MVSFLFLQSRSVQCYDVVCCQNRRGKKASFPTFPLWQTRVGGPWWERTCLCTTGNFIGKLWTGTHYSGITASLLWLLSLKITDCSPLWTPPWSRMKLDPVHWSGRPTWAVSLNYKRWDQNLETVWSTLTWVQRYLSPCYFGGGIKYKMDIVHHRKIPRGGRQ